MQQQALNGLKVLDLTHYIAGSFCTKLLADFGADVIKVERPGDGDSARRMGPFPGDVPDPEKSGIFLYLNTNKKGVTLNLKTATGVKIFKELVKDADVLVENFRPGVMSGLGLGYKTLKHMKPDLVMTSISNFGQTGPYKNRKATEITLYALSGQMNQRGDPDREPLKGALNSYQYFAGEVAATATLAAALGSTLADGGEYIDISILETMVGEISGMVYFYDYSGDKGRRTTAKNYPTYPYGGFPTKDGFICIQGGGRGQAWIPRLFEMIGKPEFNKDPRFADSESRARNVDEFNVYLYSWLVEHTKHEIFDAAAKYRYPMGPVYSIEELVNNPHYKAREFFVEFEHPRAGKATYPGMPFRTSEAGYAIRRPAPLMGQHNEEVYGELLGYSKEDLSTLRKAGVI